MASINSITQSMNDFTLEEEEEGGLAIEINEENEFEYQFNGYDAKLCLVERFITEGPMDFAAMPQTFAALWKPGKGVYMKEIDANLF